MEKTVELALQAIIRGIIEGAPDSAMPDKITQSLYRMAEDLGVNGMPAEAIDVGTLGDFARDVRNHQLQHSGLRTPN